MTVSHNFYFLLAIGAFCAVLLATTGYYFLVARRSAQAAWQDILAKLTWIDRQVIADVALEEREPAENGLFLDSDSTEELAPGELWKLLGGMEGLAIMEANSKVLIELACYLQRWYPEALPIAEQLRLDSRALQWHVDRLKGAASTGNLEISFPFYAQRAASTYYLMTRRVLALYEATNFALLPDLQRAI